MKKHILLAILALTLTACLKKEPQVVEHVGYKAKSKIAMQRVKDTSPLAKQDLVSREAMQYAMLDKMNVREERQRREFDRIQKQQRSDFLKTHTNNTDKLEKLSEEITTAGTDYIKTAKITQNKLNTTLSSLVAENEQTTANFRMLATKMHDSADMQSRYFNEMKIKYENKLAFDEAKLTRERERENTIRGVVENMYADQDTALEQFYSATKEGMLPASQWVALEDAPVTIHVENEKFEDLLLRVVNNAAVHSGPWNLKWKLKRENENLLYTKFSLDTETTFGEFITNVKRYIVNYNGVVLYFRVFKEKRVLIVSDS